MAIPTVTILSEGKALAPVHDWLSIDILKEVDRIPRAEIQLVDGSVARGGFALSDTDFFAPGKRIEIKLRPDSRGADTSVFQGIVVCHEVQSRRGGTALSITMKDAALKLTGARKSAVFQDKTDAEILKKLIKDAGLEVSTAATQPKHREIVQYYCTDWDFILSRADLNGLRAVVEGGKISLSKPRLTGKAKHTFQWGGVDEIYELEMKADVSHQFGAWESVGWDVKKQTPTAAQKAQPMKLAQGDLDAAKIAKAVGFDAYELSHPVPVHPQELQAWADARMTRDRLAMLRGRVCVPGRTGIELLDRMEVARIGKNFDGATLVTGVRHRLSRRRWVTDVQFGLPRAPFSAAEDIVDTQAAGVLPAVNGLQIGRVAALGKADPEKEHRIQVVLPAVDATKKGVVWARLASPDAGKGRGFVFRPEENDEVLVGFLNDDPRHPVILGSLYGSQNTPPKPFAKATKKNDEKGLVTRAGTTLSFLDKDKPQVLIETAKGNRIVLDEDQEMLQLTDQHKNTVTLDKDGIVIKSAQGKDIKIDAGGGKVEIKGAKVDIK